MLRSAPAFSFVFSFVAAAAIGTSAAHAATFADPLFFGLPGTTTQTWQGFTSPAGPNPATLVGNPAGTPNWFDRTSATDGAFNIGVAPTARIYSFAGVVNPQIDVPTPVLGSAGLTQIVLQAEASGSPLDLTQFRATTPGGGTFAPATVAFTSVPSGSAMGGSTFDYTVTWTNLPATSGYAITYTPGTTSSSQTAARVDTLTAVPEPASLAGLAVVGCGLLARRRILIQA